MNSQQVETLVELVKMVDEGVSDLPGKNYDREYLMHRFELDDNGAWMLQMVVLSTENPDYSAYGVPEEHGNLFLETVQESIHQSFEGDWSDYDKIVIQSYLADITMATYLTHRDPNRIKI